MAVLSVNRASSFARCIPNVLNHISTKSTLTRTQSFATNWPLVKKLAKQSGAKKKEATVKELTATPDLLYNSDKLLRFPLFNPERVRLKIEKPIEPIITPTVKPSVTRILNATMPESSRIALNAWKARMISQMGKEAFEKYQQNLFARGRKLHQQIQGYLTDKIFDLDITEEIEKFWSSLSPVFPEVEKALLLESNVTHPLLGYHGIVDCVATFRGNLVVIDWKTSEKAKPTLKSIYDNPIQAVAYLGALNYDPSFEHHIDQIAIIIAYEDGSPAQIHHLPQKVCQQYWNSWLGRLNTYWSAHADLLKPTQMESSRKEFVEDP